jgi:hypothetical protein
MHGQSPRLASNFCNPQAIRSTGGNAKSALRACSASLGRLRVFESDLWYGIQQWIYRAKVHALLYIVVRRST